MDFYERLQSLSDKKYQALTAGLSRLGDPAEIFAHMNAMPMICHEGTGLLHCDYEVRLDDRFLVICHRKYLAVFTVDQIGSFYVSASDNSPDYAFGIDQGNEFLVNNRYARDLYEKLAALCPGSFQPAPIPQTIALNDHRYSYMTVDTENLTLFKRTIFNKLKTVLVLPRSSIRSCCQSCSYDSDGNTYDLHLRLRDGTEYKIGVYGNSTGFQIARQLKSAIPGLVYEFPTQ